MLKHYGVSLILLTCPSLGLLICLVVIGITSCAIDASHVLSPLPCLRLLGISGQHLRGLLISSTREGHYGDKSTFLVLLILLLLYITCRACR